MLPPRLKEIRDNLVSKPATQRKIAESELLAELNALDASPELRDALIERRDIMKMTSGPSAVCSCCGR
jgi:hypothetical protein